MTENPLFSEIAQVLNVERRIWDASPEAKWPWKVNTVAVAVNPGGVETLAPLVDQLVSRGGKAVFITGDVGTNIAGKYSYSRDPKILSGLPLSENSAFDPDRVNLFLVSDSGAPEMALETEITLRAVKHKREFGKTIVCCIEDDTSALKGNLTELSLKGVDLGIDIDAIFTSERDSYSTYNEETFSKIPAVRFIPTGPTNWDVLRKEKTEEENYIMREKLGIDRDALVIVHFAGRGSGLWSETEFEATPAIILSVIKVAKDHPDKKFIFIYRFHPGDSQPENLSRLIGKTTPDSLPSNLRNIIVPVEQTRRDDARLFSAMANVASAPPSNTLTGGALRGARRQEYSHTGQMPLCLLLPNARKQLTVLHYGVPSAVKDGAAAFANSAEELERVVEKSLFDNQFRQNIFIHQANELRNRYRFKGTETATGRTLMQIRKLIKDLDTN